MLIGSIIVAQLRNGHYKKRINLACNVRNGPLVDPKLFNVCSDGSEYPSIHLFRLGRKQNWNSIPICFLIIAEPTIFPFEHFRWKSIHAFVPLIANFELVFMLHFFQHRANCKTSQRFLTLNHERAESNLHEKKTRQRFEIRKPLKLFFCFCCVKKSIEKLSWYI